MNTHKKWRCDHCQKFISHTHTPGTLEGIVSEGVEISVGICSKCFELKGVQAAYWNEWATKQLIETEIKPEIEYG